MKNRIFAFVTALIMFISALVSCSSEKGTSDNTASSGSDSAKVTSGGDSSNEGASGSDPLEWMDEQNYDGYEFTFLTQAPYAVGTERFSKEIFVEIEDTNEPISAAVYKRNDVVQKKLNVKIGVMAFEDSYTEAVTAVSTYDNTFDMFNCFKGASVTLSSNGYVRDWNEIPVIQLDKPWWNKNAMDSLTIGGKNYVMSGSILISEIDDTIAMVFNKQIQKDYSVNDLYETVNNYQWTIDYMAETIKDIKNDLNQDDQYTVGDDLIGFAQDPYSMAMEWGFATNLLGSYIDENNEYILVCDTDRVQLVLEKVVGMLNRDSAAFYEVLTDGLPIFADNKIFIYAIVLRNLEQLRNMDADFGVIPYPMLNEEQGKYITHVGGASPMMTIPLTNYENDERLGNILEAMACASYYTTRPAYYEVTLKDKIKRDEETVAMLDLILDSRVYDFSYISGSGVINTTGSLIAGLNTNFSSRWGKNSDRIRRTMQNLIDSIIENNP